MYAMTMDRPDKLIKGNEEFYERFVSSFHDEVGSDRIITLSEVVMIVNKQLDEVTAAIVTRRLLGQRPDDIADQVGVSVDEVYEILTSTPRRIVFEEVYDRPTYTVGTMASLLEKSYDWVQARVVGVYGEYAVVSPVRDRLEYHQEVFDTLALEKQQVDTYEVASSEDYSKHRVSVLLDRDEKWIDARSTQLGLYWVTKLNPANNVPISYLKETDFRRLKDQDGIERAYPIVDENDISVDALARFVKHDRRWVIRRLPYVVYKPVMKYSPLNSNLGLVYPHPDTAIALNKLPANILKTPKPSGE